MMCVWCFMVFGVAKVTKFLTNEYSLVFHAAKFTKFSFLFSVSF